MVEAPSSFRALGAINLVVGIMNISFMWGVSSMVLSTVGTVCTGIMTLGLCPFGVMCGLLPLALIPVGMIEMIIGLIMLVAPDAMKGFARIFPLLQIPMILLGDFASPLAGIVSMVILRGEDVRAYLEG